MPESNIKTILSIIADLKQFDEASKSLAKLDAQARAIRDREEARGKITKADYKEELNLLHKTNQWRYRNAQTIGKLSSKSEEAAKRERAAVEKIRQGYVSGTESLKQFEKTGLQLAKKMFVWAGGWTAVYGGIRLVKRAIGDVIKTYVEYADELGRIKVTLLGVNNSHEKFLAMQAQILNYARRTRLSLKDVAHVMYLLRSAGFSASEAIAAHAHVLDLATATYGDAEQSARLMTATYNVLGSSLTSLTTKQEKMKYIADLITYSYKSQEVELNELYAAEQYVASAAGLIDISIKELVQTIGFLNTGVLKGSRSGTALANALMQIANKSEELRKYLGITLDPSKPIKFRHLMEQLRDVLGEGKLSMEEMAAVQDIFGKRAARAIEGILVRWDKWIEAIDVSDDKIRNFAQKGAKEMNQTLGGSTKKLANRMRASFAEAWSPFFQELAQNVSWWAKLGVKEQQQGISNAEKRKRIESEIVQEILNEYLGENKINRLLWRHVAPLRSIVAGRFTDLKVAEKLGLSKAQELDLVKQLAQRIQYQIFLSESLNKGNVKGVKTLKEANQILTERADKLQKVQNFEKLLREGWEKTKKIFFNLFTPNTVREKFYEEMRNAFAAQKGFSFALSSETKAREKLNALIAKEGLNQNKNLKALSGQYLLTLNINQISKEIADRVADAKKRREITKAIIQAILGLEVDRAKAIQVATDSIENQLNYLKLQASGASKMYILRVKENDLRKGLNKHMKEGQSLSGVIYWTQSEIAKKAEEIAKTEEDRIYVQKTLTKLQQILLKQKQMEIELAKSSAQAVTLRYSNQLKYQVMEAKGMKKWQVLLMQRKELENSLKDLNAQNLLSRSQIMNLTEGEIKNYIQGLALQENTAQIINTILALKQNGVDLDKEALNLLSDYQGKLKDVTGQYQSLVEDYLSGLLKGTNDWKRVLGGVRDSITKEWISGLVDVFEQKTGVFGKLAAFTIGIKPRTPFEQAIYKGSESGASLFYQAIISASSAGASMFGGVNMVTGMGMGGGGLPGFGKGGFGGLKLPRWLKKISPYIAPGLAGFQMGGIGGATGGVLGQWLSGLSAFSFLGPLTSFLPFLGAGLFSGLFGGGRGGGSKIVSDKISQIPSKLDVSNKELNIINRNLVALRQTMDLYVRRDSYYFRERIGTGVQYQNISDDFALSSMRGSQSP